MITKTLFNFTMFSSVRQLLLFVLLLCLQTSLSCCSSQKLHVGLVSIGLLGHVRPMMYIAHELQSRGHQVSIFLPSSAIEWADTRYYSEDIKVIDIGNVTHLIQSHALSWRQSRYLVELSQNMYDPLYEILSKQENKPNIMLIDFLTMSAFDVADKLGIPSVVSYPNVEPYQQSGMRTPTPFTGHGAQMSWFERVINDLVFRIKPLFLYPGSRYVNQLRSDRELSPLDRGIDQYYTDRLLLCYNSFAFDYPQMIHPLIEYTGPLQVSTTKEIPRKPLESSLALWLDDLERRNQQVLYVSTGTTGLLNYEVVRLFYSGFEDALQAKSNLHILWHLPDEFTSVLPYLIHDRVRIVHSLDQPQVLEHHAVKAFLSHCGINSVYESILAQKPLLALPFRYDQKDNAARVEDASIGYRLDHFLPNIKPQHIARGIKEILEQPKYTQNVLRLQQIISSEGGAVRAVDLIERTHAIGYEHLKPTAFYTPWWHLDQEISTYALYGCLIYSQLCLLRGIINYIKSRRKKEKTQ